MRRWPTPSSDRSATTVLIGAGVASGIGVLTIGRPASDVRVWLPDFAVGAVYITAGALVAGRCRPVGMLLLATGDAWFIDTLTRSFEFLHRGPLVHLLLAYPAWRPAGRLRIYAVAVGYVAATFWPLWSDVGVAIALAIVIAVLAMWPDDSARTRHDHWLAGAAAGVFAAVIVVGAIVLRTAGPGYRAPIVHAYELALGSIAVVLAGGAIARRATTIPDLVVELGESRSSGLRDAFAQALGDPTLQLGFWAVDPVTGAGCYTAPGGHALVLPARDAGMRATYVDRGTEPLAVLVHDAAILDDASVVERVAAATRMHDVNDELAQDVRRRVDELAASRRRLVVAGDRARHRLQQRLDAAVSRRVADIEERMRAMAEQHGSTADELWLALEHLARTREDLEQIGNGLHPRALDRGLRAAVDVLAAGCPLPVTVDDDDDEADVSGEVAVTAYFVCAEALTNAVKHSGANELSITIRRLGRCVRVAVRDHGVGGADPRGSGLRGLADRVDAFGGRLEVSSGPDGTTICADLPLGARQP
ncbi:MAG TPA: ATP-binding protein [Ilumatobacter sp.]|nr:ATP-binding protein [Ilumatobacter sp.]